MCRLYGFRSNELTRVECALVHAQNALMVQSRTDLGGTSHTHGWGVVTYADGAPLVYRDAWPAFRNRHFRDAAARIYTRTVIAHVRRATVGGTSTDNTHPFTHGPWSFAHNGTIPDFDVVRPRVIDAMAPEHRGEVRGETDSEHLFRFVMSLIDAGDSAIEAVTEMASTVIGWCRRIDPVAKIGLNVLMTDGVELVGVRWGRSLYHVERLGVRDCEICRYAHVRSIAPVAGYRSVVIASEPLTAGEQWSPVPEGAAFRVTDEFELDIAPLGLPDPPAASEAAARLPTVGIRTSLSDEFLTDHRAMADGFGDLRGAIEVADRSTAVAAAERLDRISGGHVAFEERYLYPALAADDSMYEDHDVGQHVVTRILETGGRVTAAERGWLIEEIGRMIDHMEDCGRLLGEIERLPPSEQSALEDRLFECRESAPRWSREGHGSSRGAGGSR